ILGASLVFHALEAPHRPDLAVEDHTVAGALERFHAAMEPSFTWCVRRGHNTDRITLDQWRGTKKGGRLGSMFLRCHVRRAPGVDCGRERHSISGVQRVEAGY